MPISFAAAKLALEMELPSILACSNEAMAEVPELALQSMPPATIRGTPAQAPIPVIEANAPKPTIMPAASLTPPCPNQLLPIFPNSDKPLAVRAEI
ncbi:MAG: hypothetical protein KDJ99_33040 [Candidatus Competibacteraceae bacterium]|nr:hypothetical protein [Candidatus Competibacteraceae bacterium]